MLQQHCTTRQSRAFFAGLAVIFGSIFLASFSFRVDPNELYSKHLTYIEIQKFEPFQKNFSTSPEDLAVLHAAIFHLTNLERKKKKLPYLEYHEKLEAAALLHSNEMLKLNFFSHVNSKNKGLKNPEDRGKRVGIQNPFLAENIAETYANNSLTILQLAQELMGMWMNSSGHKANILSRDGLQLGCGCAAQEQGKLLCTQNFQWYQKIID